MKKKKINAAYTGSIGIVGGVGPYAGLDLAKKIFDLTEANGDHDHLPLIVMSFPHLIEDRTEFLLGHSKENPGIAISEVISRLFESGAEIVGIPCNTAHAKPIFEEVKTRLPEGLKLLNMLDEVGLFFTKHLPSFRKIGIISTTGTYKSEIYDSYLSKYNLSAVNVTEEIQERYIHPAIYDENYGIKSCSNPATKKAKEHLKIGVKYLMGQNVEAIILGCTEIVLTMKKSSINGLLLIDPVYILARSLILGFSSESLSDFHHKSIQAMPSI